MTTETKAPAPTPDQKELETTQQKIQTVGAMLLSMRPQLELALGQLATADRLLRMTLITVTRNKDLLNCTPASLMGAMLQCAQLRLEPGPLGLAYFVPFWNKKRQPPRQEVQFIAGYKGLLTLARRSGEIATVLPQIVYEGDEFSYGYGTKPFVHHLPTSPLRNEQNLKKRRDGITHFYSVITMKDENFQFEVMTANEVRLHRDRFSKAAEEGPWVTNIEEMGMKTTLRKVCKFCPSSTELQTAIALDEMAEAQISQQLGVLGGELPEAEIPEEVKAEEKAEKDGKLKAMQEKMAEGNGPTSRTPASSGAEAPPAQAASSPEPPPSPNPPQWYEDQEAWTTALETAQEKSFVALSNARKHFKLGRDYSAKQLPVAKRANFWMKFLEFQQQGASAT